MRPKTFNNGKTHKYKSAKQSDGNYTIKDIPIFAAIGEAKGFTYNKKWLFKALKTFNLRAKNGYRYRVHIEHHNGDGSREGAGYFNNLHIKPCALDGKKVYAIYADLVDIKPDVYRRIREGELPYRSVEILNPEEPEISSLALMETETPFFRLPVTTVTEAMPSGAIFSFRTFKEVMSMQKEKKGALGLFQEELVEEELEDYDDDEEEVVEEEIMCDENDKDVKMMDEEKEDLVMSMLHKIMDLLKDHNGGGVEIIDEYEDETVPPLAEPMHARGGAKGVSIEKFAQMAGQVDQLKSKLNARDREDALKACISMFKTKSLVFSETNFRKSVSMARLRSPEKIREFASLYAQNLMKAPPRPGQSMIGSRQGKAFAQDKDLGEFANADSFTKQQALQAASDYDSFPTLRKGITREHYIAGMVASVKFNHGKKGGNL